MKKHIRLLAALLVAALPFALGSCDDGHGWEIDVSYSLGEDFTLPRTPGASSDVYVCVIDPEDARQYRDNKDLIDKVKDPRFKATIRNNSGCDTILALYISYTLSGGVPADAVKVADLMVPGPAGHEIDVDSNRIFTAAGEQTFNTFMENGDRFYIYLSITPARSDCTTLSITVDDPVIEVTLELDLI